MLKHHAEMPDPSSIPIRRLPGCIVTVFALLLGCPTLFGQVRISEIMAEDRTVLADEDGEHSGWIELHNPGTTETSLLGYGLSDDPDRPFRYVLPKILLPPGGRLVVFTSGKNRNGTPTAQTNGPTALTPDQIGGVRWWVDAADESSVVLADDEVAEWRDKSGRKPADDQPAPVTPAELGGKQIWLDATVTASVETDGQGIVRWADQSGGGIDFQQADPAARPILETDGSGLPSLKFDGENDLMAAGRDISVQTLVWVGAETTTNTASLAPLVGHNLRYDYHRGDGGTLLGNYPGMPAEVVGATVYLNGAKVNPLSTVLPPGRNVLIIVSSAPGQFENLAADRLLGGRFWQGEICEIVGFGQALTETEARGLDRHLGAKWHVPVRPLATDFHARQPRPEWRPRWVREPLSGLPALRFDGVDDRLVLSEVTQVKFAALVFQESDTATDASRPLLGHSTSAQLSRGGDGLILYAGNPETRLEGLVVDPLGTRLPPRRTWLTFLLGQAEFDSVGMDRNHDDRVFEGNLHEIIAFDRALTPGEQRSLESYLIRKWRLPDRRLHANFSLKRTGEPILLTSPDGRTVDAVSAVPMPADSAYGRIADGTSWAWLETPTPGQPNGKKAALLGIAPVPTMTPSGSILRGPIPVSIRLPDDAPEGSRIWLSTDGSEPTFTPAISWLDESPPSGASTQAVNDPDWGWSGAAPRPASGDLALSSGIAEGLHQFVVLFPAGAETPVESGVVTADVWCDPAAPPRTVMLQFRAGDNWEHRAFWGEDLIPVGIAGTPGRRRMGELPSPGRWTRLQVPVSDLDLSGQRIAGVAITLHGGRAAFDGVGLHPEPLAQAVMGEIMLTNSVVIRVRTTAPGYRPSSVVTGSFLAPPTTNLPVVSLTTAPGNLFDEASGIHAAGPAQNADGFGRLRNYQRNWERLAHVELFEPDGRLGFSQACGLKIHGGYSRNWPQKSLRLLFSDRFGATDLTYPVFPGHPVGTFDSLLLRNAGNDWNRAYLRDALAHQLASDMGMASQEWRATHVFLNGAYWGILHLGEHLSEATIARQQGLASDLDIIKSEVDVVSGDRNAYQALVATSTTVRSGESNTADFAARINATNYVDWLALELFSGNDDWPGNNVLTWRSRNASVWNWVLLDCDGGFNAEQVLVNPIAANLGGSTPPGIVGASRSVMQAFLSDTNSVRLLVRRSDDLLNSVFLPGHTISRLEEMATLLADAMPAHIQRWKDAESEITPLPGLEAWQTNVAQVRSFLEQRPTVFRQHLREFYGLGDDVSVVVDAEPRESVESLRIGTLDISPSSLPWIGTYFSGLSVETRIVPRWGFKVVGWSDGAPAGAERTFIPSTAVSVTALLGVDPEAVTLPFPHALAGGDYIFEAWQAAAPAGSFPPAMAFETSPEQDPSLVSTVSGVWADRYDLSSRSRVIGGGSQGVSFVNTGNPQGGGYVVGALLALDTTGMQAVRVRWLAGTDLANARPYGIRLQWRIGTNAPFADVIGSDGLPLQYLGNAANGHSQAMGPTPLPLAANNQRLVQLRWRYHAIPSAVDAGARAQLRLDDIQVSATPIPKIPVLTVRNAGERFELTATTRAGSTCSLWASGDLGNWTELTTLVAAADGSAIFTDAPGASGRFYQIRVR